MSKLHALDPHSWLDTVWEALFRYREKCVPERQAKHDAEWSDICTAMAWIEEVVSGDPDEIAIYWHIDDVRSRRDGLTVEQCREVLGKVKDNHDVTLGVNWDAIDFWVEELFPEPSEEAG